MKDIFPGYTKKTDQEINDLWENGMILFDANVFLNLYRYSNETRKTIIELIKKFEDKIWLPHQAALEYNRNRYEVIADQEKAYREFTKRINQIQEDLQSTSKPPFLSKKVHKDLDKVFEKVSAEVDESILKYTDYLKVDPIFDQLSKLFVNKISKAYDNEKLAELYKVGKERYNNKIPPGFEDEKNKSGNEKYGDLILWMQIIDKAKESMTPIIFITDERKVDWWWKIKDGRKMGPRHELIEEMKEYADVDFHMYSSERFLSYGQNFIEGKVNQVALEEIRAIKKADLMDVIKIEDYVNTDYLNSDMLKERLENLMDRRNLLRNTMEKIELQIQLLNLNDSSNIQKEFNLFKQLDAQQSKINNELNEVTKEIQMLEENEREYRIMSSTGRMIFNSQWYRKENES